MPQLLASPAPILVQYFILILFNTQSPTVLQCLLASRLLHLAALMPPQKRKPVPFTPLPTELVRTIFELAAHHHRPTGRALLLVSRPVRRWVHPIVYATVEIFTLRRMIAFREVFSGEEAAFAGERGGGGADRLLARSVRNLAVCDDTTGDFTAVKCAKAVVEDIVRMCSGVRRLALNYTRGITAVDGPAPYELTIRRGLRGVDLNLPPFDRITHLHCRFEQLMPYVLPRLATPRLTHVCFTHHLAFDCTDVVGHLLAHPQLALLIVEVTYHKWDQPVDPGIRRSLADMQCGGAERKLFVRLSRHETVDPYDDQRFFGEEQADVWDVKGDLDWRGTTWSKEMISSICSI
ncbi:hypothetical protein BU17DRAFT_98784 [Hysterangium stoloniferum]|nr:hypothetical protein BU17DRAFT_98784 [Hysterangium stoloniferum]